MSKAVRFVRHTVSTRAWILGLILTFGYPLQQTDARFQSLKSTLKKVKLDTVYIFKQGTLIGYSFTYQSPYPTQIMLNAAHQIQWFRMRLPNTTLLLSLRGGFRLEELRPHPKLSLKYNGQGRLISTGQIEFKYDVNGRLLSIGKARCIYDATGRMIRLGGVVFAYRYDRKIQSIGQHTIQYRAEGRIQSVGGVAFKYRSDGRFASVGQLKLKYDNMRRVVYQTKGQEKRVRIRFAWSNRDIHRILKRK